MKKPTTPPTSHTLPQGSRQTAPPVALQQQSAAVALALAHQPAPQAARAVQVAASAAYVDPYLFETGFYASPAEYEALTASATTRLQLRAEAEPPKRKRRPRNT